MASEPYYILFAGVNGAGKSTLFRTGLWEQNKSLEGFPRVNPDEIIAENGWDWRDGAVQLRAGKLAVRQLHSHLEHRESFNQETTLAGLSIVKTIKRARKQGFRIIMYYIGLDDPTIANERIRHRSSIGGHSINPDVVEKRYEASLSNLVRIIDECAEAYLYDNTVALKLAARFSFGELLYLDYPTFWDRWPQRVVHNAGYSEVPL